MSFITDCIKKNKKIEEQECESRIDIKEFNSVLECPKCGYGASVYENGYNSFYTKKWDIVKDVIHVSCICGYFWVERTKDYKPCK